MIHGKSPPHLSRDEHPPFDEASMTLVNRERETLEREGRKTRSFVSETKREKDFGFLKQPRFFLSTHQRIETQLK